MSNDDVNLRHPSSFSISMYRFGKEFLPTLAHHISPRNIYCPGRSKRVPSVEYSLRYLYSFDRASPSSITQIRCSWPKRTMQISELPLSASYRVIPFVVSVLRPLVLADFLLLEHRIPRGDLLLIPITRRQDSSRFFLSFAQLSSFSYIIRLYSF